MPKETSIAPATATGSLQLSQQRRSAGTHPSGLFHRGLFTVTSTFLGNRQSPQAWTPPGEGVATALLSQEGATVVHPRVRADTHLPLSYMPWAQEPRLHWFWTPACEHCGNQGADATGVPHPGPQSHRPSAHPCAPDSVFKATL